MNFCITKPFLGKEEAQLAYVAKDPLSVDEALEEKVLKLMEALDDHDDVDNVYTNVDLG